MDFTDFADLVEKINSGLGNFCNEFQYKRKELTNAGRTAGNNELFGNVKEKEGWAINKGGGIEIQYHIGFDKDENMIRYGLGFNTQYVPFATNSSSPQELMKPFMQAFLKKENDIQKKLPDYRFIFGSKEQLFNPEFDQYTLFGKEFSVHKGDKKYNITDAEFNSMLEDLKKQFPVYIEIFKTRNKMIKLENDIKSIIDLLKYKKQIILQGPPGTGKTRLAKQIASNITHQFDLGENEIPSILKEGSVIKSVTGKTEYIVESINNNKILLSGNGIQNKDISFHKIVQFYKENNWQQSVDNGDERGAYAIAYFIYQKKQQSEQVKIIQFHPSYSYEDFVRGIVAKPNEEGDGILYNPENKIFGEFAKTANQNYQTSLISSNENPEAKFTKQLEKFIDEVRESIDKNGEFNFGNDTTAKIIGVTDGAFIYSFEKRKEIKYRLLFSDLIKIENYRQKVLRTMDIRDMEDGYLTMKGKHPYYFKVYNLIKAIVINGYDNISNKTRMKNYVMIIDEINRANLASVLGELIYALEYRGEGLESMYEVEGSNKITLPPNLYIVGTMNTADRSVGHIDYAIRRRFAFVDVPAGNLSKELGSDFKSDIFDKVYKLFYDEKGSYLSSEFKPEQVCLGHSYFIQQYEKDDKGNSIKEKPIPFKLRIQYEIIPILEEYISDGVLKNNAQSIIDELKDIKIA